MVHDDPELGDNLRALEELADMGFIDRGVVRLRHR